MRMLVVGCALAVLLGGCGSGSTETGRSASSSGSAHKTPTITQPGSQPGSLATIKQRLMAAGYSPEDHEVSGNAIQDLGVHGVEIVSYRTTAAATADYRGMRALFREHAGRGLAQLVGAHLYWLAKERPLTSAERARFEKVVRVAEGGP